MVTVRRLVECQSVLLLGQNSKSDPISANFVEGNFVSTAHHPSGLQNRRSFYLYSDNHLDERQNTFPVEDVCQEERKLATVGYCEPVCQYPKLIFAASLLKGSTRGNPRVGDFSEFRGCARVPPRSPVNGTNCTHPLRRTTHCDSVNRRVVPLKTRRGRDNDPCFSAGAAVACVSSTFRG
ncbi:hypothetical protein Y032_0006g2935 [Ancylostoma ceylanicum]|uniref:Uncharacterized protein n=1 Tax=Ancylostoma ceylanicum TaxID=53326 RepID=A0A016VQM8_9BILA|nr:hypothetical protein Y032_0006g2935 [Ancylostoma ceylanicum]